MKHLFSLLLLFFLSSQLAFALTVAEVEPNSVCVDAQLLTDMDGITTDANLEVGPGYIDKNVDTTDIYTFTIDANGTLDFYISATNTIDVYIGAAACGSNPLVLNDADSHSTSINVNSGDTITIRLEGKNDDYTYGFDLVFKEAANPTANEDSVDTWVDTAIDIDVTANDTDDGSIDKTTVDITSGVTHGSISVDAVTGVVTYTPDPGYSGTDGFKYRVQDNIGNWSLEVDVLILVKVPAIPVENCDTGTENAYRDFCLRKQTMLPGNMLTIGNTILVAPDSDGETDENPSADCSTYTNGDYIDDATVANNNFNLCAYHQDGAGEPAATTAVMVMPDANNSVIEWAGLYWQALVSDTVTLDGHSIRIKNGTDAYETITYDKLNYLSSGFSNTNAYAAFKDVTTLLQTNNWKDGNYTVADIPVFEGQISGLGTYGAWSLVIIYRNGNESIRSFSVFDGWQRINNGDNTPLAISGFYTPKSGDINASVSVFTAEGDKHITGDTLTVEDQTNGNAEVTLTKVANNTFHSGIYGVPARSPNPTNNQGIDIHTYALGNVNGGVDVLAHEQSDLTFRFKSSGDVYWPSMINFSTEVYTPSFCYDYAYKQNGVYFTETNPDILRDPYITGTVTNGDDIEVTLYILNREDSDIKAKNLSLSINDINTTQAIYKRETVEILNPEEVVPLAVPDSSLIVSDSDINNIQFEDVAGGQYFYTYYTLTPDLPVGLNNEMNISLNANFTYDLVLPTPSGGEVVIPSTSSAGGTNLPLCAAGGAYITKAAWDIFNVVDTDIYAQGEYYNIPTQVVRRVGNFSVVAYDDNSSHVNNTETPDMNSTTLVGIDLIDAGSFQSVQSACNEASTSKGITPILWMAFDYSHTIDLKQEIANAIADNRLQINSVDEYFPNAVKNAAFRISYLRTNSADEDLVKTEPVGGGYLKLLNFTELVQDIGECKQPVKKFEDPNNNLTTTLVPVACANAGNAGLSPFEMQRCMECLFGYNTDHICSRDNFSIRPESFNVKINDTNQSNVVKTRLADDVTGVAAPSGAVLDIAAGYRYNFEVNATSHVGNEATPGYSRYFNPVFPTDFNATLLWEPTNPAVNPFCNDTNNTSLAFNMINGEIDALGDHNNVGEYRFNIVDKGWTRGDWDPTYMQHHIDNPTYFIGGATGTDCDMSSSAIVSNATTTTIDAGTGELDNINGCTISSNNHDNNDANIRYRDYDLVLHPYDFNVTAVQFERGMFASPAPIGLGSAHYVYMNDVTDDTNMSVRYIGQVRAVGASQVNVDNFVANCYAENVNLSINTSALPATPTMNFRLQERNITGQIFSDTNGTFGGGTTLNSTQILSTNFTKEYKGTSDMSFNFNLDRTVNNAINPITLDHDDFNVSCQFPLNCDSSADMLPNYEPSNGIEGNATITYIYGRVHSPRQRVANPNPAINANATIPLYYEFYCDGATGCNIGTYAVPPVAPISPIGLLSPDDVRWYSQALHNIARDGNATATQARSVVDNALIITRTIDPGAQTASYTYNGNKGYPYKTTIELSAPSWLIYNRFDAAATVNNFELEFFSTGQFAGEDNSKVSVDANTSINVNRRISW